MDSFFDQALLPGTGTGRADFRHRTVNLITVRGGNSIPGEEGRISRQFPTDLNPNTNSRREEARHIKCQAQASQKSNRRSFRVVKILTPKPTPKPQHNTATGGHKRTRTDPGRGTPVTLQRELAADHNRPMGHQNDLRLQLGFSLNPKAGSSTKRACNELGKGTSHDTGGKRPCLKMCDATSSTAQPRFLQSGVSSSKIGWILALNDKPKRVEQTCCPPSLQDGRDQNATRADPGRGLASEAGPQGCLPDCPNRIQPPKIPPLLVGSPTMGIQQPPLWAEQCPVRIHKTLETGGGYPSPTGHTDNCLSRRYAVDGPVKGDAETISGNSSPHTNWPGIYNQHKQECIHPNTGAGVPGILAEHPFDDDFSATEESDWAKTDSQPTSVQGSANGLGYSSPTGPDDRDQTCHSSSPIVLQGPGTSQDCSNERKGKLRHPSQDDESGLK